MAIQWNANPNLFEIGPLHIRWYGLMFIAGFTLGFKFMKWVCITENRNPALLDSLLMYIFLGTTIGARLGHCLFYEPEYYLAHPLEIFQIWKGGLASHGGTLGVLIAVLTGAFIRIGNLMNSEILGKPTEAPWAFVFTRVDSVPRHPAQLYESLSYFIIFITALFAYKNFSRAKNPGYLFGMVTGLIFLVRFFLEFIKENQSSFEQNLPINMGQILSIPFVAACLWFFIKANRNKTIELKSAQS